MWIAATGIDEIASIMEHTNMGAKKGLHMERNTSAKNTKLRVL